MTKYDLVILGHGSAAFAAAIKANDLGIKTAMVGTNLTKGTLVGGTCVNVGCIPSKRLITVGTVFHNAKHNSFLGIKYSQGKLDFRKVVRQKDELVRKFRRDKYLRVLDHLKHVTYYEGNGRFGSKNNVVVDHRTLEARKFIVATGARANIPPVKGIDKVHYLTNEDALSLRELPQTLCVIGGRALGLEFAQMYAQFGTRVTVLQRSKRILPEDEPVVSKALAGYMNAMGIRIKTGITVREIENKGNNKVVKCTSKGGNFRVEAEHVLFATGRRPNTEDLQLSAAGVKTDEKGFVKVNNQMQTSAPNIWAGGDVTGEPMLETIAAKEGLVAVENAFSNGPKKKIHFDEIPSAVFTYPEVARVGLTESQVKARGMNCNCVTLPFDLVPKAHVIADTRGLLKLVINNDTKQILGVHIIAPHAADLIHEGVLAVKFKMTIDDIIDTVHVFPTLSESTKLAAQSFYMDIGRLSCCIG